jgi:hypothetical protein
VRLFSKGVLVSISLTYLPSLPSLLYCCACLTEFFPLFFHFFAAGSSNEAVAEEGRRHQTAAVESATRGQPGLLSAARSTTLGSSVLAKMDAFF